MNCGGGTEPEMCMKQLNLVGRQIGRLRYQRGMTQEDLSNMLQTGRMGNGLAQFRLKD